MTTERELRDSEQLHIICRNMSDEELDDIIKYIDIAKSESRQEEKQRLIKEFENRMEIMKIEIDEYCSKHQYKSVSQQAIFNIIDNIINKLNKMEISDE